VAVLALGAGVGPAEGKPRQRARNTKLERDFKARRAGCEANVRGGSAPCGGTSEIERENCVLRCISTKCYGDFYAEDPLEEGEIDTRQGTRFRSCAKAELRQEQEEREKAKDL